MDFYMIYGVFKSAKKFWLLPIILALLLFGALIILTSGSAVAPFIYTIFSGENGRSNIRSIGLLS